MGILFQIEKVCLGLKIWQNPGFKIVLACFDTELTLFFVFLRRFIMVHQCPKCGSRNIDTRNYGRKAGAGIGGIAGGIAGYFGVTAGAATGAEVGAEIGAVVAGLTSMGAGAPVGAVIGGAAGMVIGALAGVSTGMAAGAAAGAMADELLLDNYECLECGHTFSD